MFSQLFEFEDTAQSVYTQLSTVPEEQLMLEQKRQNI